MRKFALGLAMLFAVVGLGTAASNVAAIAPDGDNVYVLSLKGLTWSNKSEARVALQRVPGVEKVKVDCVKKKAWLTAKAGKTIERSAVDRALMTTRFSVASFKAPAVKAKTDDFWKVTYTRGGGWGAAMKAKKVRAAFEKLTGVESVIVDSTATAWIKTKGHKKPSRDALNGALAGIGSKVRALKEANLAMAKVVYELKVRGVGWGGTCLKVREIFEDTQGVIAVMPFGDSSKVLVRASKPGVLTKEKVQKMLARHDGFSLVSFNEQKQTVTAMR